MSHPQTISDMLQTSPDTDSNNVKEPFIYSPREQPPKSFDSNTRLRRDKIVLIQRFFQTLLSLVVLAMIILGVSKAKRLSTWQQRSYNTISILAMAMTSLCLGSLLEYLGSMLRWPLLARTKYQMRDVR